MFDGGGGGNKASKTLVVVGGEGRDASVVLASKISERFAGGGGGGIDVDVVDVKKGSCSKDAVVLMLVARDSASPERVTEEAPIKTCTPSSSLAFAALLLLLSIISPPLMLS